MSLKTDRKLPIISSTQRRTKISEHEKLGKVTERKKSEVDNSDNDVAVAMCRV